MVKSLPSRFSKSYLPSFVLYRVSLTMVGYIALSGPVNSIRKLFL